MIESHLYQKQRYVLAEEACLRFKIKKKKNTTATCRQSRCAKTQTAAGYVTDVETLNHSPPPPPPFLSSNAGGGGGEEEGGGGL